jgi:hypothetical protein
MSDLFKRSLRYPARLQFVMTKLKAKNSTFFDSDSIFEPRKQNIPGEYAEGNEDSAICQDVIVIQGEFDAVKTNHKIKRHLFALHSQRQHNDSRLQPAKE